MRLRRRGQHLGFAIRCEAVPLPRRDELQMILAMPLVRALALYLLGSRSYQGQSRLTDFNPQTKLWAFGKVSEVVWKNSKDGLMRRGVLITPPGYKQGSLYPVVVNTHPGDTAWWTGFHASRWWDWGQLLASNGYVVFLPNTRGVTGEGGAMHATIDNWGEMAFQDLMDGVDYLIAQKIADPSRLGIGGWSNGGFMTEYTITRTTRFKAAVAQAGHSDFFSLNTLSYLREGLRRTSGQSPYYNRAWYDEHSPITFIKNCRTPTLYYMVSLIRAYLWVKPMNFIPD